MQIRENIKLFLLLVTAVATTVAAYATYRTYVEQAEPPILALKAYKIEGTQEVHVDDTSSLNLKKVSSEGGFDVYGLPLKVSNLSNKDVEDILLHVDVDGGELIVPPDWSTGTYADNIRYYKSIDGLTPNMGHKFYDLKVRIKNTTHEIKVKWSILAKRTIPPSGTLIFRF